MTETNEQRIERILEKLKRVRHEGLTCFGAESHKYRLNSPIDEQSLRRFETEQGVNLPPDYRCFLKSAGNGGAGPYYGIYKLNQWNDFHDWTTDAPPDNLLALPCPLHPEMRRDSDWESQFIDCVSPYQGIISIGSQGCTYEMGLIVTGEYAGRVVYLDADGQAPYVVRERDFLRWYERWLDELLRGNDMFWFGYGLGGDEASLLGLLENPATSDADRVDAVYAIRRLPKLSPRGQERICNLTCDSVAEVRAAACCAAEKFNIVEATKYLSDLLGDESAEVRKAAITLAMKLKPDAHSGEVLQLLHSKDIDVAKRAFFRLTEEKKLTRDLLLQLVQSSPHGGLRYLAAHAIDWKTKDENLLIRLLQDEHPQVRHYAVLGVRKIRSRASLDSVIDLLGHETDSNTIDSILRMLGEVHGERNAEVLLAWTEKADDFQRLCAIGSLCKLGDIRVEPVARSLLEETRSPIRQGDNGFSISSHVKSIRDLVSESLRSSPNRELRRLAPRMGWPKWLTFK